MGRRRKCHTKEEKLAANRAKAKRHYEKEKDKINCHRRSVYRKNNPRLRRQNKNGDKGHRISSSTSIGDDGDHLGASSAEQGYRLQPYLIDVRTVDQAQRLHRRFNRYIDPSPVLYLDSICTNYIHDRDAEDIQDHLNILDNFLMSIHRYQSKILQSVQGVNLEHAEAQYIEREIRQVIIWAQEVYSVALVDLGEFKRRYVGRNFGYQWA